MASSKRFLLFNAIRDSEVAANSPAGRDQKRRIGENQEASGAVGRKRSGAVGLATPYRAVRLPIFDNGPPSPSKRSMWRQRSQWRERSAPTTVMLDFGAGRASSSTPLRRASRFRPTFCQLVPQTRRPIGGFSCCPGPPGPARFQRLMDLYRAHGVSFSA
jgi:hypothetical protein